MTFLELRHSGCSCRYSHLLARHALCSISPILRATRPDRAWGLGALGSIASQGNRTRSQL